jgi:hypothetical protein
MQALSVRASKDSAMTWPTQQTRPHAPDRVSPTDEKESNVTAPSPIRRAGKTTAVAAFGFAVVLALTYAVAPAWTREVGLDVWNYSEARKELQRANELRAELATAEDELHSQFEICDHVAARVANDSLTLRQAVDELEELCRRQTGFDTVREYREAPTFRHSVARHVMGRVNVLLAGEPAKRAACAVRLGAEYRALSQ